MPNAVINITFRFHTGSIKRISQTGINVKELSFDSILVRLKARNSETKTNCVEVSFDSKLVRLKAAPEFINPTPFNGFDSKLVRLKVAFVPEPRHLE